MVYPSSTRPSTSNSHPAVHYQLASASFFVIHHDFNRVAVLHFQVIWTLIWSDTLSIYQEPYSRHALALSLTIRLHQLLQWCRTLDFEKDLVIVLMLALSIVLVQIRQPIISKMLIRTNLEVDMLRIWLLLLSLFIVIICHYVVCDALIEIVKKVNNLYTQ